MRTAELANGEITGITDTTADGKVTTWEGETIDFDTIIRILDEEEVADLLLDRFYSD
ncbi:hypothetical protein LCGC14_2252930 [marine sediment metagenome]|uniref:Uncharacterized protein n=1 Tax=marine sediment metagenome TaxID=412755 RepID=A0A0F9DPG3_9ZZZZ